MKNDQKTMYRYQTLASYSFALDTALMILLFIGIIMTWNNTVETPLDTGLTIYCFIVNLSIVVLAEWPFRIMTNYLKQRGEGKAVTLFSIIVKSATGTTRSHWFYRIWSLAGVIYTLVFHFLHLHFLFF